MPKIAATRTTITATPLPNAREAAPVLAPQTATSAAPIVPEAAVSAAPALVSAPLADAEPAVPLPPAGVLQLSATAPSWVEVIDARGQSLIARVLQAGENVGVDGVAPFKLKVGNAVGTQVVFRGQPLELASHARDNVVRMELK
jgi:cytoskeleton protein RodZ